MSVPQPQSNRDLQAHKTWLGLLEDQRVGIVVTPPALVPAAAYANTDVIPAQNALVALLSGDRDKLRKSIAESWGETGDVVLKGLGPFCEAVLGWRPDDLKAVASDDARWSVHLPEQHESLSPTHVLMDPDAPDRPLLLVREEARNTDLDALPPERADGKGWRASPETRFERLLRDTGVFLGILFNGSSIRLVYAPRLEIPGHLTFPVRAMCEVGGRPILAGLVMLLHQDRLFTGPKAHRLPALLVESRKYQSTVSTKLAGQVLDALHALVRGFQAANEKDGRGRGELLREVLVEDRAQVYGGLLTTLMRLVFVLYAEDREMLPVSGIYPGSYSVTGLFERLREDAGRHPDTMHARYGAWAQLLTLFRVLHDGAHAKEMAIPARAGRLFDPDAYPFLEGRVHGSRRVAGEGVTPPLVSDGVIYEVLGLLLYLDGDRLSYRALEVAQIGSVYEAMMGFTIEEAKGALGGGAAASRGGGSGGDAAGFGGGTGEGAGRGRMQAGGCGGEGVEVGEGRGRAGRGAGEEGVGADGGCAAGGGAVSATYGGAAAVGESLYAAGADGADREDDAAAAVGCAGGEREDADGGADFGAQGV